MCMLTIITSFFFFFFYLYVLALLLPAVSFCTYSVVCTKEQSCLLKQTQLSLTLVRSKSNGNSLAKVRYSLFFRHNLTSAGFGSGSNARVFPSLFSSGKQVLACRKPIRFCCAGAGCGRSECEEPKPGQKWLLIPGKSQGRTVQLYPSLMRRS